MSDDHDPTQKVTVRQCAYQAESLTSFTSMVGLTHVVAGILDPEVFLNHDCAPCVPLTLRQMWYGPVCRRHRADELPHPRRSLACDIKTIAQVRLISLQGEALRTVCLTGAFPNIVHLGGSQGHKCIENTKATF
jgi:hypothetical protein